MICECCGASMVWRSTSMVDNLAKYKCPGCGMVIVVHEERVPVVNVPSVPKYYYYADGRYIVQKKVDGVRVVFGSYLDEETAKMVVEKLKEYGWDKDQLPLVYETLGMECVKRNWVMV